MKDSTTAALPPVVDRAAFQAELDALRVREKAHTREGDAIAAARRRLPMVEVDAGLTLIGPHGPVTLLDAFEGRRQLIAYYFMWHPASPRPSSARAAPGVTTPGRASCPTCTPATSPTPSSARVRTTRASATATSWAGTMPWYSALRLARRAPRRAQRRHDAPRVLPAGRRPRLRDLLDDRRGVEAMDNSYALHGPDRVRTPGGVGGLARRAGHNSGRSAG